MAEHKSPRNGQPVPRGKPFTSETAREAARKRHADEADRRSIAQAFRSRMREVFTDEDGNEATGAELIADSILQTARAGNAKMVEIALGLLGEKPADTIQVKNHDYSALDAAFAAMAAPGKEEH